MAGPFETIPPNLMRLGEPPRKAMPELLLFHGAAAGAWAWDPLDRRLAEMGFGVTRLELPGHGKDRWELPAATSMADYAEVAARAAAQMGAPVLVGHSMGGWIVQKLLEAVDLPAIMIAPLPGNGMPFLRSLRFSAEQPGTVARVFMGGAWETNEVETARRLFHRNLSDGEIKEYLGKLAPEPPRVFIEMGLGLKRARPRPGKAPRLVVAAGLDYFWPVGAMRALAKKMGAELAVLEDQPHCCWMEGADQRLAGIIGDFLKKRSIAKP